MLCLPCACTSYMCVTTVEAIAKIISSTSRIFFSASSILSCSSQTFSSLPTNFICELPVGFPTCLVCCKPVIGLNTAVAAAAVRYHPVLSNCMPIQPFNIIDCCSVPSLPNYPCHCHFNCDLCDLC